MSKMSLLGYAMIVSSVAAAVENEELQNKKQKSWSLTWNGILDAGPKCAPVVFPDCYYFFLNEDGNGRLQ